MPLDINGYRITSTVAQNIPTPTFTTEGLILYLDATNPLSYPTSGSTWYDLSANSYDGSILNGGYFNSFNGGYFEFDGTDDRIQTSNNLLADLGVTGGTDNDVPYSMECLFKADSFPTSGNRETLAGHASSGGIGVELYNDAGTTKINFGGRTNSNTSLEVGLSTNTWYHIICTRAKGGTSAELNFYLDGVLRQTSTNDLRVDYTTAAFQIADSETRWGNLDGSISLVRVYNRALTAGDALRNYESVISNFKY